jgi:hypothetical protein
MVSEWHWLSGIKDSMADGITESNEVLSASSLQRLIDIGIALSAERDTNVLMPTAS